jgi:hypothetical protein
MKSKETRSKSVTPKLKSKINSKTVSKEKKKKAVEKPKKVTKPRRSKSTVKTEKKEEKSLEKGALAFAAGSYVAFIDPEAPDMAKFKIGLIISDVKKHDDEILCEAFEERAKSPGSYALVGGTHSLAEHVVVSEVEVAVTKTKGKGKNKQAIVLSISEQQANKVAKLVPSILRSLEVVEIEQDEESEEPEEEDE